MVIISTPAVRYDSIPKNRSRLFLVRKELGSGRFPTGYGPLLSEELVSISTGLGVDTVRSLRAALAQRKPLPGPSELLRAGWNPLGLDMRISTKLDAELRQAHAREAVPIATDMLEPSKSGQLMREIREAELAAVNAMLTLNHSQDNEALREIASILNKEFQIAARGQHLEALQNLSVFSELLHTTLVSFSGTYSYAIERLEKGVAILKAFPDFLLALKHVADLASQLPFTPSGDGPLLLKPEEYFQK